MKKKLGLLISTLNSGGAEKVVSILSEKLNNTYDIYLILFEDTYLKYDYGGTLINMDLKGKPNNNIFRTLILLFKRAKKLKNLKKELGLDAVISFLDSPNFVNILSKSKKCKTIISIRNYTLLERKISFINTLTSVGIRILYNKADKIVTVSELLRRSLVEEYGISIEKIETIYNPYDIEFIEEKSKEDLSIEEEKFLGDSVTFISVGRQMYQKGYWHLLKAFHILKKNFPNFKLIIVGEDYQNGKVENLVNDLMLSENVLLVGYQSNPFKYMKKSDIYVLSSIFEGFPNAMVEAMACGCAIIANDCKSGPREILHPMSNLETNIEKLLQGEFGLLVPELSHDENWNPNNFTQSDYNLADALELLVKNNHLLKEYKKQSKKRCIDFRYEKCVNKFINIVEESEINESNK